MTTLPAPLTMYNALVRRDPAYEGVFFAAVKTTGIFCRPTCAAKKPKPANVEYYASAADAARAGYRPCIRCAPAAASAETPPLVRRLDELARNHADGRLTDEMLRRAGIEPSTARRLFRRRYGMTFHAYHRARRMGVALAEVRGGGSVISAQLNQGYDSASGFWRAFRNVFGEPPARAETMLVLSSARIDTPLGPMLAVADDRGIRLLEFADRKALEGEIRRLRARTRSAIVPGEHRHLALAAEELARYFAGSLLEFTVPIVPEGSAFDRRVWSNLRKIPYGRTWSYAELAKKSGDPAAVRAVAQANGRNSIAIVIPCHRVIRSDGSLSGYGGGVWRKRRLIELEAAAARRIPASARSRTAVSPPSATL